MKPFTDNNFSVVQMKHFLFDKKKNIVVKGENAGCQHFLTFPQSFQKVSFMGSLRFGIMP